MRALRAEGHSLRHLLECSGLRRSTYYYALWIGNTYLDDFGRDSPASLNSTGDM